LNPEDPKKNQNKKPTEKKQIKKTKKKYNQKIKNITKYNNIQSTVLNRKP